MKRSPLQRKTPLKAGSKGLSRGTSIKPRATRMRQGRSTGKPTVAQVVRFELMRAGGCMACAANQLLGLQPTGMKVEIHHLLSGGVRLGHDFTIPLCVYHHQGKKWPDPSMGYKACVLIYGPSLERESRQFAKVYGNQLDLLHAINQYLKELKHE